MKNTSPYEDADQIRKGTTSVILKVIASVTAALLLAMGSFVLTTRSDVLTTRADLGMISARLERVEREVENIDVRSLEGRLSRIETLLQVIIDRLGEKESKHEK